MMSKRVRHFIKGILLIEDDLYWYVDDMENNNDKLIRFRYKDPITHEYWFSYYSDDFTIHERDLKKLQPNE